MVEVKEPQDYLEVLQAQRGGFSFELCKRNAYLAQQAGIKPPTAMKTGTTICGIMLKDAVVLAADTRATNGPIVADKNCEKLHHIADNIWCAGAGTAADLHHTCYLMESQMELLRLATGTQPRVCTVVRRLSSMLFKYQGYIGCALVLGGVDVTGPHLYQIYPHGSTDMLPFTSMGSGSLCAMAILESEYKDSLSIEEGKALVAKAIRAGIFNDLGSGSNVDVCVVTKEGTQYFRNLEKPNERKFKTQYKGFPAGTTPILKEEILKLVTVDRTRFSAQALPHDMQRVQPLEFPFQVRYVHPGLELVRQSEGSSGAPPRGRGDPGLLEAVEIVRQILDHQGLDSEWTAALASSLRGPSDGSAVLRRVLQGHGWTGSQFASPPNRNALLAELQAAAAAAGGGLRQVESGDVTMSG